MTLILLDASPPAFLGAVAGIALILGLLVWSAGVRIARILVALILGLVGAAIAAWLLPKMITVTPLIAAIIGFVIGGLVGVFAFRILQGLTLALCLGLACAGLYYQWHVPHDAAPAASARFSLESTTSPKAARFNFTATLKATGDALSAIPPVHQKRMLIVGLGAASVALLVAFGFPWFTSWIITSIVGSLMMLAGSHALLHLYFPAQEPLFPSQTIPRYLVLLFLILLGLLIQYRLFPPPADTPRKQSKPPELKPA